MDQVSNKKIKKIVVVIVVILIIALILIPKIKNRGLTDKQKIRIIEELESQSNNEMPDLSTDQKSQIINEFMSGLIVDTPSSISEDRKEEIINNLAR